MRAEIQDERVEIEQEDTVDKQQDGSGNSPQHHDTPANVPVSDSQTKLVIIATESRLDFNLNLPCEITTTLCSDRTSSVTMENEGSNNFRSGSTWLGTIFQMIPDLLYVFEPLDSRFTSSMGYPRVSTKPLQLDFCTFSRFILN